MMSVAPERNGPGAVTPLQFVLKLSARCNLDCAYCYVFNKQDQSWRSRPPFMEQPIIEAALHRIRRYCELSGQPVVRIMFHGGEPTMIGTTRMRHLLDSISRTLQDLGRISLAMQTNAALINDEWAALLAEHAVEVGVSLDGPRGINDRNRVDHAGRGSYDKVLRGIGHLHEHQVQYNLLCVIPLGEDGPAVYRHFSELGATNINFLFPDHNNLDILPVKARFGPTPVADFLRPVADLWWETGGSLGDVPILRNICRIVMGGRSRSDMFGNPPLGFVFIETDGAIEGLDVLRLDGDGLAGTDLDVVHDDFVSIAAASEFHGRAIFTGLPRPSECLGCREYDTCAGGYLPHRYGRAGFDHRSAWCRDILALFDHLRDLVDVPPEETTLRRQVLVEMAEPPR